MIIDGIISGFAWIVEHTILAIMPTIGDTPTPILNVTTWILGILDDGISIMIFLFSAPVLIAVMTVVLSVLAFEHFYRPIMWLIRKLKLS